MKEKFKSTALMDATYSVVNTNVFGIDRILSALEWLFKDDPDKLELIQSCVVHRHVGIGVQYSGTVSNLRCDLLPLVRVDNRVTIIPNIDIIDDTYVYEIKEKLVSLHGEEFYEVTDVIAAIVYNPVISFKRKLQAICYVIMKVTNESVDTIYQLLIDEEENLKPDNFIFNRKLLNLRKRIYEQQSQ